MRWRWLVTLGIAAAVSLGRGYAAEPNVQIGILTDMSTVYADYGGPGSVIAAQMAIEDLRMGDRVKLLSADTQNKSDIGSGIAKRWYAQGVDAIFDVPNSSVGLAVNTEAAAAKKLVFFATTITDSLTEANCTGYGFAWVWDTYSVGRAEGAALMRAGKDSWFVITPDGAAGSALEQTAREAAAANGAKILGAVHHPTGEADFSSYLLQAQSSGAKAVLFGSGGADLTNALKQAREFGLPQAGITIGTMYAINTDIQAVGLNIMQGLTIVTAFDWNRNDETRAFGRRFFALHKKMPTMFQAGIYSAVTQYLKAVQAVGSTDPDKVRAYLQVTPLNDVFVKNGKVLPNGRMVHDMFLARIKSPEESKELWDFLTFIGNVPGDEAFRKLADSKCPLVKH